jgi:hypothetical protein
MKSTIIATLGLFAIAIPASAGFVLQPAEYAREYCNLRSLGWGNDASVEYAVLESVVPGLPVEVLHNNQKVDADVVMAFQAAKDRCPQYHK